MAILNRPAEYNDLYDKQGRLQGGLSSLETLARVIAIGSGDERDQDTMDDNHDEIEPALELPVTNRSRESSLIDSDEDMSDDEPGSSDGDALEEIMMDDPPKIQYPSSEDASSPMVPSSPNASSLAPPAEPTTPGALRRTLSSTSSTSESSTAKSSSIHSRRSSKRTFNLDTTPSLPIGEETKKRFLDANVASTLLVSLSVSLSSLYSGFSIGPLLRIPLE